MKDNEQGEVKQGAGRGQERISIYPRRSPITYQSQLE
jgi:hypothetical protein